MRLFALTSFAALMVAWVGACSDGVAPPPRGGGTGGTGGEFVTPANIDQLCRDFCANTGAGEDCGPVNCERFFSCSSSSDIQGCYESCQDDYQRHGEGQDAFGTCRAGWECFDYPARCPEEWLARLTCVLDDFECNDLFGDCDSLTDTLNECYTTASQEERTQQVQWCEETCPAQSGECGSQIRECWPGIPLDCSDFQSPPEGCGEFCNDDFDCQSRVQAMYCFNDMCAAECTNNEDGACDAGEVCNEGRCYPAQ
jgi:hypothetical protein